MPDATHNTACIGCGYLLRSLCDDDACPECGLSVAASRRQSLIHPEDATTRRAAGRGLASLWVTLLAPAVLLAIAAGVIVAASIAADFLGARRSLTAPALLAAASLGESAWAWWNTRRLVTTTEHHAQALGPARAAARSAAVGFVAATAAVGLAAIGVADGTRALADLLHPIAAAAWVAARGVWGVALSRHLARILVSSPGDSLRSTALPETLWVRAWCGAVLGAAVVATLALPGRVPGGDFVGFVALVTGLVWVALTLMAVIESRVIGSAMRRPLAAGDRPTR